MLEFKFMFLEFEKFVEKNRFFFSSQIVLAKQSIYEAETFAYDLDQIILRSQIPVIEEFNKRHKTFYHWYEHGWDSMREWLRKDFGYTDNQIEQEYKDLWENAEILSNAPIIKPTLEFINKMKILGKKQLIITSRKPHLYDSTVKLLEKEHWFKRTINFEQEVFF